jgi:hypothetical protein
MNKKEEEKKEIAKSIFLYYAAKIRLDVPLELQTEILKQIDAILDMYLESLKN